MELKTSMILDFIRDLEKKHIWDRDYRHDPTWKRFIVRTTRTLILLARDLIDGELSLRAMSLVYTTLLSLVPLLALSFSILKGFGVQNQLDAPLRKALEPLGEQKAAELTQNLIGFVNNMNVGVLGAVGLAFLIFTVISLMQKIEGSFNYVWRIRVSRTFVERFTTFLSAITIGPLLIFAAMATTGTIMSTSLMTRLSTTPLIGPLMDLTAGFVPFTLVIAAFTFFYAFIPNTKVHPGAALTGGIVAGFFWEALSFGFAYYASDTSSYQLVYATFATAIFFMIWLYLNWLILLIGASIAFYQQHPEIVATGLKKVHFNPTLNAKYVLSLIARTGKRFYDKLEPYSLTELTELYDIPGHVLESRLALLIELGILAETDEGEPRYVPAIPLDTTTVAEVLRRVETFQPAKSYTLPSITDPNITAIDQAVEASRERALSGITLKQLALSGTEELINLAEDGLKPSTITPQG
ncbi:MAG: YihY/virulence factor BrkB family protein [Gammaproteobacteria bacterium]|nr:YihY/virulence factor BrkB family protein [Gammaproteobacteria bacterium]